MENLIERLTWHYVPFTDWRIPFGGVNMSTVMNTVLVMVVLLAVLRVLTRRMKTTPDRGQALVELLVETWDNTFVATFDDPGDPDWSDKRHRYVPLLSAAFLYVLAANSIVAIPLPFVQEPTADLNCTLALGVFSISYATFYGFYYHGVGALKEMAGPLWDSESKSYWKSVVGKSSALLFFPIHVTGEISRVLSLSFRLFGNMLGGATIMAVLFLLTRGLVVPLFLNTFFLAFDALIQAYVFSTLTLVYIASSSR